MKTPRRTKILDATQELLLEVGNAGLTMRKVAARTGISLGNLQYHFATREDLMMALLLRFLEPYEARLETPPETAHAALSEVLEQLFIDVLEYPDFDACAAIYKEIWAVSNQSPEMMDALGGYYRRLAEFYRQALAMITKREPSDPKVERATQVLLPMLEGAIVTYPITGASTKTLASAWAKVISFELENEP